MIFRAIFQLKTIIFLQFHLNFITFRCTLGKFLGDAQHFHCVFLATCSIYKTIKNGLWLPFIFCHVAEWKKKKVAQWNYEGERLLTSRETGARIIIIGTFKWSSLIRWVVLWFYISTRKRGAVNVYVWWDGFRWGN